MKRVATLAVYRDRQMLWGLRRDNLRWTTPGGHLEEGEDPTMGALRELAEETGIIARPEELRSLGATGIVSRTGVPLEIHMFRLDAGDRVPKTHFDPDEEVHGWEWVDTQSGMPAGIHSNMHSSPNCLLERLGLNMKMSFMRRLSDEDTSKDKGRSMKEVSADIQKAGTAKPEEKPVPEPKKKTDAQMEENPADFLIE